MIHERLDIDHWKQQFPLPRLREKAGSNLPGVPGISGPLDVAVLEQLRDASYANAPGIERVPTDVFVWSRGEPNQRTVTKIGGLPYRAADTPWPLALSGTPMTFVAQICFADSHDLTPELPGDILLIFTEATNWGSEEEPLYDFMGEYEDDSYLLFEWISLNNLPLVSHQQIPATGLQIMPCYGTLHRTWDYLHVDGFAYPEVAEHIPSVIEATKIGGICPWSDMDWVGYADGETEGYFCSLRSLDNEVDWPFPFLNDPEPISWTEWSQSKPLMIGDVGFINLFLKPDGTVRWRFHG